LQPDIVGCTAITPAVYKAERVLQLAKEVNPSIFTVLGGIHATFMYPQVLQEAPWIDAIVRGQGEQVLLNLVVAVDNGNGARDRSSVRGVAFLDGGRVVATPAEPPIKDLDRIAPDWGILEWNKYVYIPMGKRLAIPNFARGCPFTCSFCSQWKFWRDYRIRDPIKVVDEIETLVRRHDVGFFILADAARGATPAAGWRNAACGDVYSTADAAQAAKCDPGSRGACTRPLGGQLRVQPQVVQDLLDHRSLEDGRNDLELPGAAVRAVLHVDIEHAPEQPPPS